MMRKPSIVIPLVILWCSLVSPEPGTGPFAGVYLVMPNFEFRESERKIDRIAPSAPSVSVSQIWRGRGTVRLGENVTGGSTDDFGSISLQLAGAKDNRTPADSLGYRAHFVDGILPDGLAKIQPGPFGPLRRGIMHFGWTDGATWYQEPFSFRLYVTAVDWAGNESAPSDTILVEHNGDTSYGRKLATRTAREPAALAPAAGADPPDSTGTFSVTPPGAIDWSGEKTETLFFILGMLDEYHGRQWTEGVDQVERFYCSEHVEAFVFLAYLNRLASEQGLDPVIDTELNDCLVYFHSKPLADLINSFYAFTTGGGYANIDGQRRSFGWAHFSYDQFEQHGPDARLVYLAGAYYRYGADGYYRFANSGRKAQLIARLLEEAGCARVETISREGIPFQNEVHFEPTPDLSAVFARLPVEWSLAKADSLVGFATEDELAIYRIVIKEAQRGAFEDCVMTSPCVVGHFTIIPMRHEERLAVPESWMERALEQADSGTTRLACLTGLQSDAVNVAQKHPAPGDLSTVWLRAVGFDPEGDGAVVLFGYYGRAPGSCSQHVAAFLRKKGKRGWVVTNYSVANMHRMPD